MSSRVRGWITLAVQACVWTLWCFISAAPVALLLGAMELAMKRDDLSTNVLLAVLVEMAILGSTAFGFYRLTVRADTPGWSWLLAPAGYLVSFGGYLLLERLGNGLIVTPAPGAILELVAVSTIVGAGAYVGGLRASSPRPADGANDETGA